MDFFRLEVFKSVCFMSVFYFYEIKIKVKKINWRYLEIFICVLYFYVSVRRFFSLLLVCICFYKFELK